MANKDIGSWTCNDTVWLSGNITQLQAIAMASPGEVASRLGLSPTRFVRGYWICLLNIDRVDETFIKHFYYAGTTLLSGGRMGVPADTPEEDAIRPDVHNLMRDAYGGKQGYRNAQRADLQRIAPKGHNRLVKIVTVVRHLEGMSPAAQYPVGGAHLQWKLNKELDFTCAAFVDGAGMARTRDFTVSIAAGAPRDNLFRLERYLEQL